MRLNAVKVLGISITNTSKKEILEEIQKYLDKPAKNQQKPLIIFTPNTEQVMLACKNPHFAGVLNQADIAIPDAVGVVWASRKLTTNGIKKTIPGVEFMGDLVGLAQNRHVPVGLIGGRDNLAVETLNCLRQIYGKLSASWAEDGPEVSVVNAHLQISGEELYIERLARRIIRTGVRSVFVALGPPKQEYVILALARALLAENVRTPVVLMAVGGSFDIIAGRLPRAPIWMRSTGLEWLWRLILEPRRIGRQMALLQFVGLVIKEKLR